MGENIDKINGVDDYFWKKFTNFPQRNSYYNLHIFFENKITAVIEHNKTQEPLISASTKEWAIRRKLYGDDDLTAAFNIGRVISDRALICGINKVHLVHRDVYNLTDEYK